MTAIKKKTVNKVKKVDKVSKEKKVEKGKWRKVKIKGKVISDDGGGYEGLIGLEVLENYQKSLINKPNQKKNKQVKQKSLSEEKPKKQKEKPKKTANKNEAKNAKKRKTEENEEYAADRFALLRPPPSADEEVDNDDEVPELVAANNSSSTDDMQEWMGLNVPPSILKALAEKGFKSPTEIQISTLPAALLGKKDILGAAETGSGKTLAFGIPILAGIMELKSRKTGIGIRTVRKETEEIEENFGKDDHELTPPPEELEEYPDYETDIEDSGSEEEEIDYNARLYALILTPTRELAVQVRDHLVAAAKYTGIKVVAVFGGLSVDKQQRLLRKRPEVLVATPGRLWELYEQENIHLRKLEDIAFLAIDETDRMLEKGHFEELHKLLKVINSDEEKKKARQNFVFSATLTLVHDIPEYLQKKNIGKSLKFVKKTPGLKLQNIISELGISQPKIVDITKSQRK